MLSERDKREREADRENERVIAEAYCKALGLDDDFFQHVPLHPVDISTFLDEEFFQFLEIRVRGKTIEQFEKEGWIPVGQPKWDTVRDLKANFLNFIRSKDGDEGMLFQLVLTDTSDFQGYVDRRPYRRREWVYKVPVQNFVPVMTPSGPITIPNDRIHFRKKGKDTTDLNKEVSRRNSKDIGVQRSQ